jgi:hypothetical protein
MPKTSRFSNENLKLKVHYVPIAANHLCWRTVAPGDHMRINFNPIRIASILLAITVALTLASVLAALSGVLGERTLGKILNPMFDLTHTGSIGTWFKSALLLGGATLLWLGGSLRQQEGRRETRYWGGLAALLVALALETATGLIHQLNVPLRHLIAFDGPFLRPTVILMLAAMIGVGVLLPRFLHRLPDAFSLLFTSAFVLYGIGAVGLEMVALFVASNAGMIAPSARVLFTLAQGMQLGALVLLAYNLMLFAGDATKNLDLHLEMVGPTSTEMPAVMIRPAAVQAVRPTMLRPIPRMESGKSNAVKSPVGSGAARTLEF